MKQFVITFIGKDQPGLVDQLAEMIIRHKGNWLGSSMSHLAGKFAGILQVELPELEEAKFCLELGAISHLNTHIEECHPTPAASAPQKLLSISLVGNDRPGIVQEVTKVLHSVGANVEQLTSSCESAANTGQALFKADLTVLLPEEVSSDRIQDALESLANDIMVDIEFGC